MRIDYIETFKACVERNYTLAQIADAIKCKRTAEEIRRGWAVNADIGFVEFVCYTEKKG